MAGVTAAAIPDPRAWPGGSGVVTFDYPLTSDTFAALSSVLSQ